MIDSAVKSSGAERCMLPKIFVKNHFGGLDGLRAQICTLLKTSRRVGVMEFIVVRGAESLAVEDLYVGIFLRRKDQTQPWIQGPAEGGVPIIAHSGGEQQVLENRKLVLKVDRGPGGSFTVIQIHEARGLVIIT